MNREELIKLTPILINIVVLKILIFTVIQNLAMESRTLSTFRTSL